MDKRFCPQCQENGTKSRVYSDGGTTTLLAGGGPFWDEDGNYHHHEINTTHELFHCDKAHRWSEKQPRVCPTCGIL